MLRASSSDPTTYTLSSVARDGRKRGKKKRREGRRKGGEGKKKGREGRRKGGKEGRGRRKEGRGGEREGQSFKLIAEHFIHSSSITTVVTI